MIAHARIKTDAIYAGDWPNYTTIGSHSALAYRLPERVVAQWPAAPGLSRVAPPATAPLAPSVLLN